MPQTQAATQRQIGTREKRLGVVKVGGSLLNWPALRERLTAWVVGQAPASLILICGGGGFTDEVRRAQAIHHFDDEKAHWLCVQALSATARLLTDLMPQAKLMSALDEVLTAIWGRIGPIVFDAADFLIQYEPHAPGIALPHNWSATTDSIAARVAALTGAAELVLLKSADPPPANTLAELAAAGYVDQHFPIAAAGLPYIRLVNLRSPIRNEATITLGTQP